LRFDEFGLDQPLLLGVRDMSWKDATPIQEQAIPAVLGGRDVIGLAQTGTGKTAAFLLPILNRLLPGHTGATRALILAPTRELASQIDDARVGLTYHTAISGALVLGGANADTQERALKAVPDIVIATPGRLLDFLFRNLPKLDKIEILVLDEADRMLDMGFMPDIEKILRRLPEKRQNLLFSATMPPPIEKLAREIMTDPLVITIGARSRPVEAIEHRFERVHPADKVRTLLRLLREPAMQSVICFTKTKIGADRLWRDLIRGGVMESAAIHGDRSQKERFEALEKFRAGQVRILIATDVAARGIDVDGITHVVNYDVPRSLEDYVHRVGRTARAGESGIAITLVTPEDDRMASRIEHTIEERRDASRRAKIEGAPPPAAPPPLPASGKPAVEAEDGAAAATSAGDGPQESRGRRRRRGGRGRRG
jgi:ATP-dependent RNA helicase RhlE